MNGFEFYDSYEYGYSDYPDFGTGSGEFFDEFFGAFLGVYLVILLASLAISTVMYVLQSVGLYKMSKTLGLSNPWLAWVPVCNLSAIGRLAECSNLFYGKKKGCLRVLLPLLWVLLFVPYVGLIVFVVLMGLSGMAEDFSMIAGILLFALVILGLAVTILVLQYVALHKIYKLFDPNNAALYTVLSVLFSIAISILLFVLRNRLPGGGKPQPVPVYGQPPYGGAPNPMPPAPTYYAPAAQPPVATPAQPPVVDPAIQNTYMPPQNPTES